VPDSRRLTCRLTQQHALRRPGGEMKVTSVKVV
jgi:hypothetical protein